MSLKVTPEFFSTCARCSVAAFCFLWKVLQTNQRKSKLSVNYTGIKHPQKSAVYIKIPDFKQSVYSVMKSLLMVNDSAKIFILLRHLCRL